MKNEEKDGTYGEPSSPNNDSSIRRFDHRVGVRRSQNGYMGGTNLIALHNMVFTVLKHLAEDAHAGTCTEIMITLDNNQIVFIQDNAPSLPVHRSPTHRLSALEILMTSGGSSRYLLETLRGNPVISGRKGFGLAAVNALSEWMIVQTNQQGVIWQQTYFDGVPQTPVERRKPIVQCKGTTFIFRPDFTIFQPNEFQFRTLARRCFELAYLIPNLRVTLRDKREGSHREVSYFAAEGTKTFIEDRFHQRQPLHPIIHARQNVLVNTRYASYEIGVEFAMLFTRRQRSLVMSYINTTFTPNGGAHQEGFLNGILAVIDENFPAALRTRQQMQSGLIAIFSIRHPHPQFESQTNNRLVNLDTYDAVFQFVRDTLRRRKAEWLPPVLEKLIR